MQDHIATLDHDTYGIHWQIINLPVDFPGDSTKSDHFCSLIIWRIPTRIWFRVTWTHHPKKVTFTELKDFVFALGNYDGHQVEVSVGPVRGTTCNPILDCYLVWWFQIFVYFCPYLGKWSIKQVTRQQISVNISGIAFSTRANVVSTFQTGPPAATCLLVPASEKTSFDCEPPLMTKGPYEIIVQDEALGSVYKRQVLLVQQNDEVSHQLPTPKYNSTAPALSEIVIEVHEALITKELATSITEKPLEVMKKIVIEQFPSNTVKNLHGHAFRIIQTSNGNSQNRIFQVMCKIPTTARAGCLERSGAGDAFFRDFVGKGESVEDLSTLPKFWSHDRNSKDNALRSASSIVGFAGLTLTRRGIAVRAWNSKIGHLRKVLFADDERISTINIDVIPKFTRESTGWPSSIGASEVVKATSHELGIPPIPTRCYKALGVTTWTLTFQEPPKKTRFLINFNGSTHEILITEPSQISKDQSSNKKGKGKAKGKGNGNGDKTTSQSSRPSHIDDDSTNQRLSVLEAKFCTMERRQDGMEAKINEGFSGVNNQLRQILHAIQPRSSTGSTGASPPQKVPKTGNN